MGMQIAEVMKLPLIDFPLQIDLVWIEHLLMQELALAQYTNIATANDLSNPNK